MACYIPVSFKSVTKPSFRILKVVEITKEFSVFSNLSSKLILSLLMLPAIAVAGENIESKILGISADGKVISFLQTTVQDGSGMALANIIFVDTTKNTYAAKSITVRESENSSEGNVRGVRKQALKQASTTLTKLGITLGSKLDSAKLRLVYASSNYVTSSVNSSLEFTNRSAFWQRNSPGTGNYKISLESTPTSGAGDGFRDGQLLTVKLTSSVRGGPESTTILQKDVKLPASREYAYAYGISEVYLLDPTSKDEDEAISDKAGRLVIVLDVFQRGFEGATTEKMVVTGFLNKK